MSALGSFSRVQIFRIEYLYKKEYPFDNRQDDKLVRHHFLQRIQHRTVLHSMSALSISGALAFFGSKWLEQMLSINAMLKKYSSGDNVSKFVMLGSMILLYSVSGRVSYIKLNDLVDIRTQYGREFVSIVMKLYPNKVNYELIQNEASDLLRVAQIQNHQTSSLYPPQTPHYHQDAGFIAPQSLPSPQHGNQPIHYANSQNTTPYNQAQPFYGSHYGQYYPNTPQAPQNTQAPGINSPYDLQQLQYQPVYQQGPQQYASPPQVAPNPAVQFQIPPQNPVESRPKESGNSLVNSVKEQKGQAAASETSVKSNENEFLIDRKHVAGVRTVNYKPVTPQPGIQQSMPAPNTRAQTPQEAYLRSGNNVQYQDGYYMVAGQNPTNQANPLGLSSAVGVTPYHEVGQPRYLGHYAEISERAKQGNI